MARSRKDDPPVANKKVVLVTGGNGRLGKELIRALIKEGNVVRALVKKREYVVELPLGVIPYVGDLSEQKLLEEASVGADVVYHLAAIVSEYKAHTKELMRVNVEGTRNMLDACEVNAVGQFVYTSSVDVYGRVRRGELTEESELKPSDRYGYSKMLAEQVIRRYKSTVPYTILRISAIYGPGFENSFFKIFRIIKEQKARIIGSGENKLELIHLYDVLQALMLAKNNETSKNNIYNVTDGNNYTQKYLFELAAELLKVPPPTKHVNKFVTRMLARRIGLDSDELRFLLSDRSVDITKIRTQLGFDPIIKIRDGGQELVNQFLNKSVRVQMDRL